MSETQEEIETEEKRQERRRQERRKEKNSFIMYDEYNTFFTHLNDDELGKLIREIFSFSKTKEKKDNLDTKTQLIYDFIVERMKKDTISYDEICAKRALWGKIGGETKAKHKLA